jgi:putative membrane protein
MEEFDMARTTFATTAAALLSMALAAPAAAQGAGMPSRQAPASSSARAAGTVDAHTFMTTAAEAGKAEVALAQLAQKSASNAGVKSFAARLEADHTKANGELMSIARTKKVSLPADVGAEHKAVEARLASDSGAAFDRAYITQMVTDHQQAIDLFTKASASDDRDVKAFAVKTLPTLKAHLAQAQTLQKQLK